MGSEIADLTAIGSSDGHAKQAPVSGWRPCDPGSVSVDDGRFLLDHFLGLFCNPFYRINSEADLYDETIDVVTGRPFSLADFKVLESGADAPDGLQRELGSFLAGYLLGDCEADLRSLGADLASSPSDVSAALSRTRRIRARDPFRPRISPELERHLLQVAAARCGQAIPSSVLSSLCVDLPQDKPPIPRSKPEHEARFQRHVENLRAVRNLNLRTRANRLDAPVLIVGAGPAGLIRAIAATMQGLKTIVLELRPEHAAKRPQIVVIRSHTVISLLEQLGVIDFLFKENRIFPLGRLQLEVSLADLELAFLGVLRAVATDASALSIHYGAAIERIDQVGGFARVVARQPDRRTLLSFAPQIVVIADGKHGTTSSLLGISRREQLHSHTGIIAIFRAGSRSLSRWHRLLGDITSKLNYAFHRYLSRRGRRLLAGTILQVPGHHYLGLDLTRDEEMRLRGTIERARKSNGEPESASQKGYEDSAATDELRRLVDFWSNYGFEAIRTHPKGSAPHTGGRPISWLPLEPQFAMPIEVVSDRADAFCGYIGETFVMLEGDAQFTIHPGSAYGCTKAFLSARLFGFLLGARYFGADERRARLTDGVFLYNAELMARACDKITRFFRVTT